MTVEPIAVIFFICLLILPFLFIKKEGRDTVKYAVDNEIEPRGGLIVVYGDIVNYIRSRGCKIEEVRTDKVLLKGRYETWKIKIINYGQYSFVNVSVLNRHPLLGEPYKKDWEQTTAHGDPSLLLDQIKDSIMSLDERIKLIEDTLNN